MKIIWTLTFPCGTRVIFEEGHRKSYITLSSNEWYDNAAESHYCAIYKYQRMRMSFETYKKRYLQ